MGWTDVVGREGEALPGWPPGDGMFLAPRMRRMTRMKMMMRMTTRMKTMSLRVAAPALPPQGTLRTRTPTEAQPHLGLPSPLFFPLVLSPAPAPHFLSFFLFLNKIWWGGEGLEEPRPGLCGLRDISPGDPPGRAAVRLSHHWTGPAHHSCTCGSGTDNGPGSGVGVPEFSEAL